MNDPLFSGSETLQFVIDVQDRGTQVLRSFASAASGDLQGLQASIKGVNTEAALLGGHKPLVILQAQEIANIERAKREMAALDTQLQRNKISTQEHAAQQLLLTNRINESSVAMDRHAAAAQRSKTHVDLWAAAGVVAGVAIVDSTTKAAVSFDNLQQNIEQQTGASRRSLNGLMSDIKTVYGATPHALDEVASTVVALRQRLHESDKQIQETTHHWIDFAELAKTDVHAAVYGVSQIMRVFGVDASHSDDVLNRLVKTAQATGQPLGDVLSVVQRYGPQFKAMGLGLTDVTGLLYEFNKRGVDTQGIGRGLSTALATAEKTIGNTGGTAEQAAAKHETYALAVEQSRQRVLALEQQIASGARDGGQLAQWNSQLDISKQRLQLAQQHLDGLNISTQQAAQYHGKVSAVFADENQQIQNAKTYNDALNLSIQDYGRRLGPMMAQALFDNGSALKEHSRLIDHAKGSVQGLAEAEQHKLSSRLIEAKHNFQLLEADIGTTFIPVLKSVVTEFDHIVAAVERFLKQHPDVAKALADVAPFAAGAGALTLVGRHTPLRGPLSQLPGVGRIFQTSDMKLTGAAAALDESAAALTAAAEKLAASSHHGSGPGAKGAGAGAAGGAAGAADAAANRPEGARRGLRGGTDAAKSSAIDAAVEHPVGTAAGLAAGIYGLARAGAPGVMNTPGNKLNAFAQGVDPTNVLHLVGLPSLSDLLPAIQQAPTDLHGITNFMLNAPAPHQAGTAGQRQTYGTGVESPEAQRGGTAAQFAATHAHAGPVIKDFADLTAQAHKFWQEVDVTGKSFQNWDTLVEKALTGAHTTTTQKISAIVSKLQDMPPQARVAAADMALGMTQELEQKGELTKGAASRIHDAILATFGDMKTKGASQGAQLATQMAAAMAGMSNAVVSNLGGLAQITDDYIKSLGLSPVHWKGDIKKLAHSGGAGGALGYSGDLPAGATGMRVPGPVGPDNIPIMAPGGGVRGIVAGGELLVANRHTEAKADRLLGLFGTSLGALVAGERTPHSAPGFASGGRLVFPFPGNESFSWARVDQGQDLQGPPGGPVVAVGSGTVDVGHDRFGGFGPYYPILHLDPSEGGTSWYYGHAKTTHTGHVGRGEAIGVTQQRANTWTAAPAGWLEFGPYPIPPFHTAHGLGGQPAANLLHQIAGGHSFVAAAGGGGGGSVSLSAHMNGPAGPLQQIAQALLSKATHASMHYLNQGGGGGATGPIPNVKGGLWNVNQLARLWDSVGGPPAIDTLMGRIAYYGESGGNPRAYNPSGASGFWQILGQLVPGNLFNPKINAENAVAKWQQQGLIAWAGDKIFESEIRGKRPTGPGQYSLGGQIPFAGAFGDGGMVTAHEPTMMMIGDKGSETAIVIPHGYQTGGRIDEAYTGHTIVNGGIRYEWHKDPGAYFTAAGWQTYSDTHKAAKHHAIPGHDRPVVAGHESFGTIHTAGKVDNVAGQIDLGAAKEIGKLAQATWSKVSAAVLRAISNADIGQVTHETTAVMRAAAQHPHSKRLQDLARASVTHEAGVVTGVVNNRLDIIRRQESRTELHDQLAHYGFAGPQWAKMNAPTRQAYADYSRISGLGGEIVGMTGQRHPLEAELKHAQQTHNKKLAAQIKSQIADLDDTIDQARVDRQSAKSDLAQQIKAIHQKIHDDLMQRISDAESLLDSKFQGTELDTQILQQTQHNQGLDLGAFQKLKDKQGGVLTPDQIAQATTAMGAVNSDIQGEETPLKSELGYDQSIVNDPSKFAVLTPAEQQNLQNHIKQLTLQIAQLDGTVKDNNDSLTDLTTATTDNTSATREMTGSVTFSYQGQDYVAGGSSTSYDALNIGVGS